MTDEELIARLLDWEEYDEGDINDAREAAANRIKELKAELAGGNLPTKLVLADLYGAQAAEIKRLRGELAKALESLQGLLWAWNELCRAVPVLFHDPNADAARATIATLTGSTTVKDSLTTEDEKQSHEWKCPIDYPGCRKNCGSQYGCKN